MKSIIAQLSDHVRTALGAAYPEITDEIDPQIRESNDMRFGDYQSNVAMGLAKKLGHKPRELAQAIMDNISPDALKMVKPPAIAGPGFINFTLRDDFLASMASSIPPTQTNDRMGIESVSATEQETVVVDYSSPNVAKEMHVGHLRSTIIGDTIARIIEFQGHHVVRQNHLGDWGTQFGMIILGIWHMFTAGRRGDPRVYFAEMTATLSTSDATQRTAVLEVIAAQQQADLDADPNGEQFDSFLDTFEPEFELLLAAYRYVNVLEGAAAGSKLAIYDARNGKKPPLAEVSKHVAAMLQGALGDSRQEMKAWRKATEATLRECDRIYQRLGVLLSRDDVRGESYYHPLLPGIVEEMRLSLTGKESHGAGAVRAICRDDQGAACIFIESADGKPMFKGPTGDSLPMLIQKSDGAYLYATTDLAAALNRTASLKDGRPELRSAKLRDALTKMGGGLNAQRVIYVVGAPQKLHFEMLFAVVGCLGWVSPKDGKGGARLEHVAFGSVLGDDRKMLRTRSGESVKLKDLLDEAVARAEKVIRESESDPQRRRNLAEPEIAQIAQTVGIASVKYADLCQNRSTDYVFSWDKMLALQGNTAPYLLYAYARIRSICRKGEESGVVTTAGSPITLAHPAERALGLRILQLADMIPAVGDNLLPNVLCDYLYDLAGQFMAFYENCPVLQAPDAATIASRLRLCELTARALQLGLSLMGIPTLERM